MNYNNLLIAALTFSIFGFGSNKYYGSTTAPVTLAGAIIKSKQAVEENHKKYKRKDCPVCKGKGWYMSGDNIKKIDCSYCEEDTQQFKLLHKNYDRK